MAEEFDLTNKAVILRILTETEKSEDKNRRKASFDAYQIYSGNQKPYVVNELIRTRPKSYQSYTVSDISVSKMVTDKRAQSYNEDPIRSVDGDMNKTEALSGIYKQADALRELQHHDVVFNLNRYDLIWVNYLTEKQKYQIMTLQPYEFVLVFDKDTGELLIVGLSYPDIEITQNARSGDGISDLIAESQADSSASGQTWVFWSDNQHVKIKTRQKQNTVGGETRMKIDIDYMPIEGNPGNVNPLGVLPFVYTSSDTAIEEYPWYWDHDI